SALCLAFFICICSLSSPFTSSAQEKESNVITSHKNQNPKKSGVLYVPLIPEPTDPSYSGQTPLQPASIFLETVVDDRDNKEQIGQNIEDEDKPPIKVLADEGDDPVEFVRNLLDKQFRDAGI